MSDLKRLTLDIEPEEHSHLKALCAALGISMREFLIIALRHELEKAEDLLDRQSADQVRKSIREGRDDLIEWKDMEKRVGWDEL
jgi:Antitoxin ParD